MRERIRTKRESAARALRLAQALTGKDRERALAYALELDAQLRALEAELLAQPGVAPQVRQEQQQVQQQGPAKDPDEPKKPKK